MILPYKIEKTFRIKKPLFFKPREKSPPQPRTQNINVIPFLNFPTDKNCLSLCNPKDQELEQVPIRVEKSLLLQNQFIGQIENKFLVSVAQGIILLWDQHALHERIRLEQLQTKFLSAPGETCSVKSCPTPEKISLNLSRTQLEILNGAEYKLEQYGLVLAGMWQ